MFLFFSVSLETSPSTTVPMNTASDVPDTSVDNATESKASTSLSAEEIQDGIRDKVCPILFSQESRPLRKFKELAMRRKIKVLSECYVN